VFAQPAGDLAAVADDEPSAVAPPAHLGYGAMPGGLNVATAETLPVGTVGVALLSGYGYRKGLLAAGHTLNRAIGDVAAAYAALPYLTVGLSLDGRYDKHKGLPMIAATDKPTDDGYVGDPHLLVRVGGPVGGVTLGGQLGVWVPGKTAPSIAGAAISVDARALLSLDAGFGVLSFDAGFRVDNSAKSAEDVGMLSLADRVSLGVSDFSAALFGASLRVPTGSRAYVELEGSSDVFVGSGAPGPILRGGAVLGVALSDAFSAIGYVEVARVPQLSSADIMAKNIVLIPYEPSVTAGVGLQARFGGPRRRAAPLGQVVPTDTPRRVEVAETADVTGVVFDETGKPVVGAKVTVQLKNSVGTTYTDGRGTYTIVKLPIGKTVDGKTLLDDTGAEIAVEVADKKPGATTLTLTRGINPVPPITLDPQLPPGQLRAGIINAANGRPVANATVTIEPGGVTATSGPDGKLTVDLPPGRYKITVTARGLAQQQLDVNIEQNGVAIKNIELHK
jgi:hypothetical protein